MRPCLPARYGAACVTVLALVYPSATAHATSASTMEAAKVDLNVTVSAPTVVGGGSGVQVFTVSNTGQDMRGEAVITYTTPIFVNVDESKPLPQGCGVLHRNKDFQVPEVIRCTLPAVYSATTESVTVPVTVAKEAPAQGTLGMAVVLPATPADDAEQHITDNISVVAVVVLRGQSEPEPGNGVDLYLAGDTPPIAGGESAVAKVVIGNRGTQTTSGPVRLDFATPLYVNTSRGMPLPKGCELVIADTDPAVPEVVECSLTDPIPVGGQVEVGIPLQVVPGGPLGQQFGAAIVTPDDKHGSADRDGNLVNNLYEPGVAIVG